MQGYRITEGQANMIVKPKKFDYLYFNPVRDINGNLFIFEQERQVALKHFDWAADLVLEEYVPPVAPPDPTLP